jgi:4-amino-4-deoxy-L-arabinose transferase-like glycosyltransferase
MFSKKNIYVALVIVILLGAFLRFYKLGNNSFVADEFLDINSSYAYAKTGIWQNWDFNFGRVNNDNVFQARDERAWVYKWPVAKLFNFFPPTENVARSVSALWGVFTIFLIYLVATYFTKKKTIGLLSAFLFAVSISGIEMDRKLRMYAMFLPVYLLFSWLLFRFLEDKYKGKIEFLKTISERWGLNLLFLIPVLLAGILSLKTHQLTGNMAFVIGFYLLFWGILTYRKNKSYRNKYFVIFVLTIIGVFLMSIVIPGQIRFFTSGLQFFNNHWEYVSITFSDYSNGMLGFILAFLGIYFLAKKQNMPKEGSWLAISFLAPLLAAIFLWNRSIGNQYIFFIKSFEIILVASGIYFTAEFFKDNLKNYEKKAYLIAIIISLLILPNYAYFLKTSDNAYNQTSASSNPNYRKIFTYFKKAKKDGDVLITRNFRNYYWSGAKIKVFDFGGELAREKLSLEDIKKITTENSNGWFIVSSNDESFIANDAIDYVVINFEKVSNSQVRGDIMVYRWGKK